MARFQLPDNTYWNEFIPATPFCSVTTDGVIRGSCTSYHKRKDITDEILSLSVEEKTLEAVEERYGKNCVVLVGEQSCRERALIPPHLDPSLPLNDVRFGILEVAGMARYNGIFRANITNKYLKIDSRSTFHFVKALKKVDLLSVKIFSLKPEAGGSCQNIHVVFLKRFAPDNEGSDLTLQKAFCNYLSSYPQQTAPVEDIAKRMGPCYRKVRYELFQSGAIETACIESSDDGPPVKALRLVQADNKIDSDEEEEEEEMTGTVSIVSELPLDVQAYRFIDDCGTEGVTMTDFCQKTFTLNQYICRAMAKNLVKQSYVSTLMFDSSSHKVRTLKLISGRHVKSNKDVEDYESEYAKHDPEVTCTSLRTGVDLFHFRRKRPKKSRAGKSKKVKADESMETEAAPTLSPNVTTTDVTTDDPPVQVTVSPVKPKVKQEQGTPAVMTITQLKRLNWLMEYMKEKRIEDGRKGFIKLLREREEGKSVADIKTITKLVNKLVIKERLCAKTVSVTVNDTEKLLNLYHLPDVTEEELKDYELKIQNDMMKSSFRKQPQVKPKPSSSDEENISESEGVETKPRVLYIQTSSKFQRIKQFHVYLWVLLHGFGPVSYDENESESSKIGYESVATLLPEATFPWIRGVDKLASSSIKNGSIAYCDILFHMPFSLLNTLSKPFMGKDHTDNHLYKYFVDSTYNCTPLHSLPKKLRRFVTTQSRDQTSVRQLLNWMSDMKLVTINGPYKSIRDRSLATVSLNYDVEILDTSSATPRWSFFLNEARSLFPTLHHKLTSLNSLEYYWYTLNQICLSTPIVIGGRGGEKRIKASPTHTDEHSLPYVFTRKKDDSAHMNDLGFGAGGLPPLFFSHMAKNWSMRRRFQKIGTNDTNGSGISPSETETEELKEQSKTMMGMALPARSGGKGLKRERAKKALHVAHKMRQKKIRPYPNVSLTSLLPIARGEISAEDMNALSRKTGERAVWYPHEDNFVLLSYIATLVLRKLGHPPTDQAKLRDAIHRQFKTSRDKTVSSLHGRLVRLLKNCSTASLDICVNEIIEELNSQDNGSEQNFDSLLDFVLKRYISHDGHLINISLKTSDQILPSTLQELEQDYEIPEGGDKTAELSSNQIKLLNIILAMVGPNSGAIDSYNVFKILEQYPESDIKVAMDRLKRNSYIVNQRVVQMGTRQTKGSLENRGIRLGSNFYQLFEGTATYSREFFHEIRETELSRPEQIEVEAEAVRGGDVAYFIGHSFDSTPPQSSNSYFCEPHFSNPLLINDKSTSNQLVQSAIEEEDPANEEEDPANEEEEEELEKEEEIEKEQELEKKQQGDSSKPISLSMSRSSVSTFLNIDETSELQHGTISLRPPVNIGHLLDPLEDEAPQSISEEGGTVDSNLSIDSFLALSSSQLQYSPVAIETARQTYTIIDQAGVNGVTMATLLEECKERFLLETAIQDLINFELIFSVGTTTPLFVSHTHRCHWYNDIGQGNMVPIRPWVILQDSAHTELFQKGVLVHIISRPGITMACLLDHYKFVLQQVSLEHILQNLLAAGCIRRYTLHQATPCHSPFFDHTSSIIRSCRGNDSPSSVCYEAVISAESLWATNIMTIK